MEKVVIGIDIGGTNIKLGLVTIKGKIFYQHKIKTKNLKDAIDFLKNIAVSVKNIIDIYNTSYYILGIGIGSPGPIINSKGIVLESAHLPFLKKYPLVNNLKQYLLKLTNLSFPIVLENDGACATLGAFHFKISKKVDSLAVLTLGTGIGGGLIINSKLFTGYEGNSFEIGHIPVTHPELLRLKYDQSCNCGSRQCFETIASATGVVRIYNTLVKDKNEQEQNISDAKSLKELAQKKNVYALKAFSLVAESIGIVCSYLIQSLNLKTIIITGGLSDADVFLKSRIKYTVSKNTMAILRKNTDIQFVSSKEALGILGAASLIFFQK